jgi:hypothetical protein
MLANTLKTTALAALLGLGVAGASGTAASAYTIRTRCYGDDCVRLQCNNFGDECFRIGYFDRGDYYRSDYYAPYSYTTRTYTYYPGDGDRYGYDDNQYTAPPPPTDYDNDVDDYPG